MIVLAEISLHDGLIAGAGVAGFLVIAGGFVLGIVRSVQKAEAVKQLREAAEALREGASKGHALSADDRKRFGDAAEEAEKLLQALPEHDRLPGLLVLVGLALIFIAFAAAGLIDFSLSSNSEGAVPGGKG